MKKIDRRIVIVASLIFIIGLSYGIMRFLISQKEAPPEGRAVEARRFVQVELVEYADVLSPVSETGRMSSVSEIDFAAEAPGKIIQGDIELKKGSSFKKGDVIFSIYPDEAALALKAKKSQFLNSLALMLPDISIDFPVYENAFRAFFSSIDIDKNLPPFPKVAEEKLQIFLASKNILSDFYSIQKDELQLSRHVVRAPFSGALLEVYMEVGAYAGTGSRIAHGIRTDELELEVPLMRFDAQWVNVGDRVIITSEGNPESYSGTVKRKSQFVDEGTQSQNIYIGVKNHQKKALLKGEYFTAIFNEIPVNSVMEIPRNAVFNSNEVFIVEGGRLQNKIINIVKVNTKTLLFNGLSPGDTLVVQPLINVYEGTIVTTSLDQQPTGIMGGPGSPGASPGSSGQKKFKKRNK